MWHLERKRRRRRERRRATSPGRRLPNALTYDGVEGGWSRPLTINRRPSELRNDRHRWARRLRPGGPNNTWPIGADQVSQRKACGGTKSDGPWRPPGAPADAYEHEGRRLSSPTWTPRYRQIELALRARLATMRPGERLPSDADLCSEFGVSRMTARNAMQRLAADGLVERISGRGSFAMERPMHRNAYRLLAFSHEMERQGREPRSRPLAREIRRATDAEAAQLRIEFGSPIAEIRRVRLADEIPMVVENAIIAHEGADVVMQVDLESWVHARRAVEGRGSPATRPRQHYG